MVQKVVHSVTTLLLECRVCLVTRLRGGCSEVRFLVRYVDLLVLQPILAGVQWLPGFKRPVLDAGLWYRSNTV